MKTINRDTNSYTQGFEIADGILYESGGQIGRSLIRKVNLKTGAVIKSVETDKNLFAEGLTVLNDKVYQLTWQNGVCLIYDKDLNLIKKTGFKTTNGEGWGLCNNGKSLIVSDGSNKLSFLNPLFIEVAVKLKLLNLNFPGPKSNDFSSSYSTIEFRILSVSTFKSNLKSRNNLL